MYDKIIFVRNPVDGKEYAVKIFEVNIKEMAQFVEECKKHVMVSDSKYVMKAKESVEYV